MSVAGKYLGIFVDEGRDLVKRVSSRLLRYEEEPGDAGALESALRMIHTLKGSSKMVGLDNISRAAHAIETTLKERSAGLTAIDKPIMNSFFAGLDQMEEVLNLVSQGQHAEAKLKVIDVAVRDLAPPQKPDLPPASKPKIFSDNAHIPAVVQSRPMPADGMRVAVDRIDKLQEQVEDLIVQKWQIFSGLERLQKHFAQSARNSEPSGGRQGKPAKTPHFTSRDLSSFSEEIHKMSSLLGEVQLTIMDLRMLPLSDLFGEYKRMVRDLSVSLAKDVALHIEGDDTEVDRNLLEGLQGPLTHLVRNAIDHGIESPVARVAAGKDPRGNLVIRAYQKPSAVVVEVEDDGKGLDPDRIRRIAVEKGFLNSAEALSLTDTECFYLLCRAGFTSRTTADEVSGRGVGLDAVKVRLERLRGSLSIQSEKGRHTIFRMFLPQSLSTIRGLVAKSNDFHAAFPTVFVERCFGVTRDQLAASDGLVDFEGEKLIPVGLTGVFGFDTVPPPGAMHIVVLNFRKRRMAVAVDRVEREQELIVKNLGAHLHQASSVLGISLLADGTPAPILDITELYERWPGLEISSALPAPSARQRLKVLVVDDAVTSRHVESTILESMGHDVEQAGDGLQAIRILEKKPFDLVVTDLEMPHVDGIELVREIRRDEKMCQMPVIMVTSVAEDEAVDRAYQAGVNAYLTKDRLSRQALGRAIRNLFPL